jgi:transcriptional regulator with XRE-family HTH domain
MTNMLDGTKVKRLRKARKWSLRVLGERMGGLPSTTIFQLESKPACNAMVKTILLVCNALGCRFEDVLTDTEAEAYLKVVNRPRVKSTAPRPAGRVEAGQAVEADDLLAGIREELRRAVERLEAVTESASRDLRSSARRQYPVSRGRLVELLLSYRDFEAWTTRLGREGADLSRGKKVDPVPLILDALGVPQADERDDRSPAGVRRAWAAEQLYRYTHGTGGDVFALIDRIELEAAKWRTGAAKPQGKPGVNGSGKHS